MKAIQTKYVGPRGTRGSRIIATDHDGHRVSVTYDDALNNEQNHQQGAIALCNKLGWAGKLTGGGFGAGCYVFVWQDRESECIAGPPAVPEPPQKPMATISAAAAGTLRIALLERAYGIAQRYEDNPLERDRENRRLQHLCDELGLSRTFVFGVNSPYSVPE